MKTFNKPINGKWLLPLSLALFVFISCQKELDKFSVLNIESVAVKSSPQAESKKINVNNLEQLYASINDPANNGYTIVLAPGTYLLSPSYPNGGRLELQHDMTLQGQPGHPEAVIIDATDIPPASLIIPPTPSYPVQLRTGVVRVGNGYNAIEWMTLQNDPNHSVRSLIQADLVTTITTQIRIAHTIVKGSQIGISVVNRDAQSNGRVIEIEMVDNEITNNIISTGVGIQIQNSQAVNNAVIRATLRNNYIHGNRMGIFAFNGSSIQNSLQIKSYSDRIEDNGVGLDLYGGLNERANFPTDGNTTLFEAYGSTIKNNSGIPAPSPLVNTIPGGVTARGAYNPSAIQPGTVNNNTLEISFWGCSIEGNAGAYSINAYAAISFYPSPTPAGSDNKVILRLNGLSKQATVNAISSLPTEPAGTNTVNIYR
jgi:hypothetical protein